MFSYFYPLENFIYISFVCDFDRICETHCSHVFNACSEQFADWILIDVYIFITTTIIIITRGFSGLHPGYDYYIYQI